ncbi:MAG: hypothetical protein Q8L86_04660 [Vicinamibacterales bacterium]|nr:hypothetical protein [Vicinamibacterales bacterium]
MWARLCTGLLVLAMVASGATVSEAHLHTANGHRVAGDSDHAGDPARPLWHAHGAPHAHEHAASTEHAGDHDRQDGEEDIVYVGDRVASPRATPYGAPPIFVAVLVATSAVDVPVRARAAIVRALPPVHAPPLMAPRASRAPPASARLFV